MSVTIAELNFRTLLGLGDIQPEWCSLLDVHNAVVQKLSVRARLARSSDNNAILSTTRDFSPATTEPYSIQTLIHAGTPCFLEMENSDGDFSPVKFVPLENFVEMRDAGEMVWTYWREEQSGVGIEPKAFIQFSIVPTGACRLRYDREEVAKDLNDVSPMPDAIAELIVKDAQISLIPVIKLKIQRNMRRAEMAMDEVQMYHRTFDDMARQYALDAQLLTVEWKNWAFRSAGGQANFTKRTPNLGSY